MASTPHDQQGGRALVPAVGGGIAPRAREMRAKTSINGHVLLAIFISAILVGGGIGGWATFTQISGAVIAGGQLVVESDV